MRKYINPKEVNEIYGIKPNTLARQRSGGYGIPFHRLTKPDDERNHTLQC